MWRRALCSSMMGIKLSGLSSGSSERPSIKFLIRESTGVSSKAGSSSSHLQVISLVSGVPANSLRRLVRSSNFRAQTKSQLAPLSVPPRVRVLKILLFLRNLQPCVGLAAFQYSMCVGCIGKQDRFFPQWMPQMHNPHPGGGTVPRDKLCKWAECQSESVLSLSAVVGVLALRPFFPLHLGQCCAVVLAILLTIVSPAPVPVHVQRPCQLARILPRLGGI